MASDTHGASGAIAADFKAFWEAWLVANPLDVGGDVHWPGMDFTPPDGPWVRHTILYGEAASAAMGGAGVGENAVVGIVIVQLFDRPGNGTKWLEQAADAVRDQYTRAQIGDAWFEVAGGPAPVAAPGNEGEWLQVNVAAPFELEETV